MIVAPTVRLAVPGDAAAIARMSRSEIEHGLGWSWTPQRVARAIADPAVNVAIAQEGEGLAGFGIMKYGETKAHLLLLATHPRRREHGVGGRLLDWLEECALTAGLERIELEVRADNPVALAFYGLRGYRRFDTVRGYYRGRIDALRLARQLIS